MCKWNRSFSFLITGLYAATFNINMISEVGAAPGPQYTAKINEQVKEYTH